MSRRRLLPCTPQPLGAIARCVLDASGDLVVISDSQHRIVYFNPSLRQLLPRLAAGRLQLQELFTLLLADEDAQVLLQALEGRSCITIEAYITPLQRWHEVRVKPYRGGRLVLLRDISERKRAQTALNQQQEYLLTLHETALALLNRLEIDDLLEAIVVRAGALAGTEHGFVYMLDEQAQIMSRRVATGVIASCEGRDVRPGQGLVGRVWQSGEPMLVEDYANWPDRLYNNGPDLFDAMLVVPLVSGGQVVGAIGLVQLVKGRGFGPREIELLSRFAQLASIALDNARLYTAAQQELEERRRAEEALRESEERYRRLVEFSPDPIVVHCQGRIVYANAAAAALRGVASSAELLGRQTLDFIHPDYHQLVLERIHRVQQLLQPAELVEERLVRADGSIIEAEVVAIPTTYQGRPASQVVLRDITERRQAERSRLALERKLLETQKLESLGVLAGGIAHDFNNLLVAILGNASLAQLELEPETPARETLRQIELAAQHAADLTRQLLAYAGKGRFVTESLSLNSLVAEMAQLLQPSITRAASLSYNLQPSLPAIEGHATQIRQVILNLILNAAEAIGDQHGSVTLSTRVTWADQALLAQAFPAANPREGYYVCLEVNDTGCGMDSETQAKIFDPFFTTKFTGRGLGLAAVLGIVRGHGGALRVSSTPGEGTCFQVFFPAQTIQPLASGSNLAAADERYSGTVLLIDDDPRVRQVTTRMLEHVGFSVLTAADGASALELVRDPGLQLDCILLDLTIPHVSGTAMFEQLCQLKPDVRIVLISGYSQQEATRRFAGSSLAGFLQKPFTLQDLCRAVQQTR